MASVGYSKKLHALEIEFRHGGTYRYLEVPPQVYRDFLRADSKAGFYNRRIRGKYVSAYVRVNAKE
ncbi:MAG: KTSC domain-containing protein [Chthoniobacterales bacterium]